MEVDLDARDLDASSGREFLVVGHLLALVVSHRQSQGSRDAQQALDQAVACGRGLGVGELDQHQLAAGALDQGADRRAVAGALDQISFPVSRDQPTLDLLRALMDARHVADLAALLVGSGPSSAMRFALPKTGQQLLLQLPTWQGVDCLIDRLTDSPEDASTSSSMRFLRPEICSGRWRSRAATASNCPASADLGGRRAARPRSAYRPRWRHRLHRRRGGRSPLT